jgi:hypothetical protein
MYITLYLLQIQGLKYFSDNGQVKPWSINWFKNRCWGNKEEDEDVQKDCLSKLCMDHEKGLLFHFSKIPIFRNLANLEGIIWKFL